MSGFWSDSRVEPKRAYRWLLRINGIPTWFCKKVSKPSFAITESAHTFLNHKFYYPGRVEWNTVTVTLADPATPDATKTIVKMIENSGYRLPDSELNAENSTISKQNATLAVGSFVLEQLDAQGNPNESWELINPWVKDVKFGDLDYESDEMVDVEIEFRYDFARCDLSVGAAPIPLDF